MTAPLNASRGHFSLRRVLLCTLPLLGLLLWIMALSGAAAGSTATAETPARISVPVPQGARSARIVMLEVNIAVARKADSGQLGAVVRLRPAGGNAVEVGRVSVVGSGQSYQFNVSRAVVGAAGSSAEVEVAVIDRGGAAASGALSIGRAQIVLR
jgi:hypothetical protein